MEKHRARKSLTAAAKSHRGKKSVPWVWLAHRQPGVAPGGHVVSQVGEGGGRRLPTMSTVTVFALSPQGASCLGTQRAWLG